MNEIAEPPTETQALQRVDHSKGQQIVYPEKGKLLVDEVREITPQQARNESIATMLDAAYQRASTLQLTPDEAEKLAADFPDEAFELGAGGDRSLLYLSHVYIRQRLNQVLGIGASVPIRRREWSEEFTYFKDGKNKQAARVYVEMVLLVRGCVVGEAIADAIYYKENSGDSYADTLEKAKSNAFRRCAKEFGVGLQPWMKGFCEQWKQRNLAGGSQNAPKQYAASPERTYQKPAPPANVERTAATPASVLPEKATPKTREYMWNQLVGTFGESGVVWNFLVGKGLVDAASDDYSTWNLEHVPTSKQALAALADEIRKTVAVPSEPEKGKLLVDSDLPPDIHNAIITVPRRGMKRQEYLAAPDTIGSLYVAMKNGDQEAQKRLWGMVKGWNPEPYVDGNGKKWPVKAEDAQCRIDLDCFADFYASKHGESQ